jgi:hypothetical protein
VKKTGTIGSTTVHLAPVNQVYHLTGNAEDITVPIFVAQDITVPVGATGTVEVMVNETKYQLLFK